MAEKPQNTFTADESKLATINNCQRIDSELSIDPLYKNFFPASSNRGGAWKYNYQLRFNNLIIWIREVKSSLDDGESMIAERWMGILEKFENINVFDSHTKNSIGDKRTRDILNGEKYMEVVEITRNVVNFVKRMTDKYFSTSKVRKTVLAR